mmetsp:Transcript_21203/g.58881  ORF Transcript_21203/g.58881 Transcript_21203/m.58881 type:complete len:238 (-) Transcript_21203:1711-2424(-)
MWSSRAVMTACWWRQSSPSSSVWAYMSSTCRRRPSSSCSSTMSASLASSANSPSRLPCAASCSSSWAAVFSCLSTPFIALSVHLACQTADCTKEASRDSERAHWRLSARARAVSSTMKTLSSRWMPLATRVRSRPRPTSLASSLVSRLRRMSSTSVLLSSKVARSSSRLCFFAIALERAAFTSSSSFSSSSLRVSKPKTSLDAAASSFCISASLLERKSSPFDFLTLEVVSLDCTSS